MHEQSQKMVEALRPGQEIPTAGGTTTILKTGRVRDASSGSYAYRVVIRTLPDNDFHPFVVHTAIFQDDEPLQEAPLAGRWVFEQGDYARTLEEALEAFARREGG